MTNDKSDNAQGNKQDYEVKNVKSFRGHDGNGYNATLYRNGNRVASLTDMASGGPVDIDWEDSNKPQVSISHPDAYNPDEVLSYKGTPEEKIFQEFVATQTYVSEFDNDENIYIDDIFLGKLVDTFETKKNIKKDMKKSILFITADCDNGEYRTMPIKQGGRTVPVDTLKNWVLTKGYPKESDSIVFAHDDITTFIKALNDGVVV